MKIIKLLVLITAILTIVSLAEGRKHRRIQDAHRLNKNRYSQYPNPWLKPYNERGRRDLAEYGNQDWENLEGKECPSHKLDLIFSRFFQIMFLKLTNARRKLASAVKSKSQ